MEVTVQDINAIVRRIEIALPAERVGDELDRVVRELSKRVRIPGFRPGKTPLGLIERRFWDDIKREVEDHLIEHALIEVVQARDLPMVGTSAIKPGTLKRGETYAFSADIEVRPEIELGAYTGLELKGPGTAISDGELAAELERLRSSRKNFVPVTDRTTTQAGDLLVLDYKMHHNGALLSEQDNVNVPLGEGHFLPEKEALLVGKTVPCDLDETVTYPADFPHRDLAGKQVQLKLHASEIKRVELPELDDSFAESFGKETLADLKQAARERLEQEKQREARQALEETLTDKLIGLATFEVPPSMVHNRVRHMIQGAMEQLSYLGPQLNMQLTPELYQKLSTDYQPRAEREVRANLILTEIAKAEALSVTDDELDGELTRIAQGAGQTLEQVRQQFEHEHALEGLRLMILRKKAVDWLLERSAIDGAAPAIKASPAPRPKPAPRPHHPATPVTARATTSPAADEDNVEVDDESSPEEEDMPVAKKKGKKAPAKKTAKKVAKKAPAKRKTAKKR